MFHVRPIVQTLRLGSRRLAATALLATALAASTAQAQFGGRAAFGEAFQPDLMQRDLPLMIETLKLEEWQRPIIELMLTDYTASFNTGLEGLKDRMKKAAEDAARGGAGQGRGDAVLEKVMEPWGEWRVEKRKLFEKFISDLQSQLGPEQRELWPRFERALRRERQLHEGTLSGESLNLWSVANQVQLTPAEIESTRAVFDTYEVALDNALTTRMTRLEELEGELRTAMQAMDYDKGADIQDRIMALRIAVRTANDEGIAAVAGALGERGEEFRKAALAAGYPDAFRKHPVIILIDQSLGIDSLTAEQRTQIEALRAEFAPLAENANSAYYEMLRLEEPKIPRRKVQMQQERRANAGRPSTPQGANLSDPIIKARVEREQLGEPYRQRLMAILTPEQAPEVPGASKLDAEAVRPKDEDLKRNGGGGATGVVPAAEDERGAAGNRRRDANRRNPREATGQDGKPTRRTPPRDGQPGQPQQGQPAEQPAGGGEQPAGNPPATGK